MKRTIWSERIAKRVRIALMWMGIIVCPETGLATESDFEEDEVQTPWERLTEREDKIRTQEPLVVGFLGRPLTMNGQYEAILKQIDRIPVGSGTNDYGQVLFEQEIEVDAFYGITPTLSLYLQLRFAMEEDLLSDTSDGVSDAFVERGEMWINYSRIMGSPLSIEVGRLDFEDDRLWWWDEDLDAVRLMYETELFEIAFAFAEELFPARTGLGYIDPEQEDIQRLIAEISMDWSDSHVLQLFALHQDDRSKTETPGALVRSEREDESDAQLTWFGARATGAFDFNDVVILGYWIDVGRVAGWETILETEDVQPLVDGTSRYVEVEEVVHRDVRAWAIDTGVTLVFPTAGEPRFTVAWAKGSGDRKPDNDTDTSYHQTGIHGNECAFGGVERFQVYGEILDPELSNISIVTAGLGFSLFEASSLDFVLHDYRLVEPTDELRDSRLDTQLNETDRDLGTGIDIIMGLEEWDAVQFKFGVSAFKTGKAFGVDSDKWIYGGLAEFRFAF